jgi:hypothetical protein
VPVADSEIHHRITPLDLSVPQLYVHVSYLPRPATARGSCLKPTTELSKKDPVMS